MTTQSMTVTDVRDVTAKKCYPGPWKLRTKLLLLALVLLIFLAALAGYLIGNADRGRKITDPPDPYEHPKPSPSRLRFFPRAAVCTDSPICSDIGKSILQKNGSAVDAAVAAMFCNSIHNQQSMGIGGGHFMVVYIKEDQNTYVVNAREAAPGAAHRDMYKGQKDLATKGPLAVGIPGELRGMWTAHQRWGKLPWADLLAPTLDMCDNGYNMSQYVYQGLEVAPWVKNDPLLRKQYYNSARDYFHRPGTLIRPSDPLCRSLRVIAAKGGDVLYNGTLAADLMEDLIDARSIITADDLRNYEAKIEEPLAIPLGNGDTLYTPLPPSSGLILVNILNILRGYNFTADSISSDEATTLTYHRIVEAFKFAYGTRTKLGDAAFLNLTELMRNVTDPAYGPWVRARINDSATSNDTAAYGADLYSQPDAGTAHISVIAANGDAVSVTSSVNYYFGAGFTTKRTGIILNNVMDDFSSPGILNYFGLKPSPANFIEPLKRPLSSMCPSIIVDRAGNVKMVIGASGGTKITSAVALVLMRKLWMGQSVKQAVDAPRIHHQLVPMRIEYEFGTLHDVIECLRAKGHEVYRYRERGSVVCTLYRNVTGIYANSDFRKGGDVAGMD